MFDVNKIRRDFPVLEQKVNGKKLVYLDNAATSQKPECVIQAIGNYYRKYNANVHRGIHKLAEEATQAYENARTEVAHFINADPEEIIFTSGTTASINLAAYSLSKTMTRGDEIITTIAEHHSNFVPWQQYALEKKVKFTVLDIDNNCSIDLDHLHKLMSAKTKIVAVSHVSNVLGTENPIAEIIKIAHDNGSYVLVDAAQSVPHIKLDVKKLDVDFLAFSGHKMLGPTGIGVLYMKKEIAQKLPVFLFGGSMIKEVYKDRTVFADLPAKYEAGTPNIEGVIGLGEAIKYLNGVGVKNILAYDKELVNYALNELAKIKGLKIIGPADTDNRVGIISFTMEKIHSHDLAQVLDNNGIAIRAGHHCAMPLHDRLGITDSARASFYLYNTLEEVDRLVEGIKKAKKLLG